MKCAFQRKNNYYFLLGNIWVVYSKALREHETHLTLRPSERASTGPSAPSLLTLHGYRHGPARPAHPAFLL